MTVMTRLSAMLIGLVAQTVQTTGTLRVEVIDASSSEAVPGATVTLVDLTRTGITGSNGRVSFGGVPPGPQHVSVRRPGYGPRVLHALVPAAGTLDLIVVLSPLLTSLREVRVEALPGRSIRDLEPVDTVHVGDRDELVELARRFDLPIMSAIAR